MRSDGSAADLLPEGSAVLALLWLCRLLQLLEVTCPLVLI